MLQESTRNVAEKVARSAAILLDHFDTSRAHHIKKNESANTVTEADLAANRYILSAISSTFPTHGILSEESEAQPTS